MLVVGTFIPMYDNEGVGYMKIIIGDLKYAEILIETYPHNKITLGNKIC